VKDLVEGPGGVGGGFLRRKGTGKGTALEGRGARDRIRPIGSSQAPPEKKPRSQGKATDLCEGSLGWVNLVDVVADSPPRKADTGLGSCDRHQGPRNLRWGLSYTRGFGNKVGDDYTSASPFSPATAQKAAGQAREGRESRKTRGENDKGSRNSRKKLFEKGGARGKKLERWDLSVGKKRGLESAPARSAGLDARKEKAGSTKEKVEVGRPCSSKPAHSSSRLGRRALGEATVKMLVEKPGANAVIADLQVDKGESAGRSSWGPRRAFVKMRCPRRDTGTGRGPPWDGGAQEFTRVPGPRELAPANRIAEAPQVKKDGAPHGAASFHARDQHSTLSGTSIWIRLAAVAMGEGTPNAAGERGVNFVNRPSGSPPTTGRSGRLA